MKRVVLPLCVFLCTLSLLPALRGDQPAGSSLSVIDAVAPVYPGVALALPKGGSVVIEVAVDQKGAVLGAKPLEGSLLLYQPSLEAAKRWKFSGTNQERTLDLTFIFRVVAGDAQAADTTSIFHPPYTVEVRRKMPERIVQP